MKINLVNLSTWCFFYIIQDSNNFAEHFCSDKKRKTKKKKRQGHKPKEQILST